MAVDIRPAQALKLKLLHALAHARVTDGEPDLSHLAVLLTLSLEMPPHTGRGLAAKRGVTKPVISRALNTMGRRELLGGCRDGADRRNGMIQRTVAGARSVERLGDLLAAKAKALPR